MGDVEQDQILRGGNDVNIFDQALSHFKNDPRAGFYYTTISGFTAGIENATRRMVDNGNFVAFNFYGDLTGIGGKYSHKSGFSDSIQEISRLAKLYPRRVISSPHINRVISTRSLFGREWGYDVCPSVTYDHPENESRMTTGKKYPTKFRAYNADLKTTRRCCIGSARDCETCTDLWAIYGWVIGSMKDHLSTKKDFTNWLCIMYIFYMQTGFIDWNERSILMPEIYNRFDTSVIDSENSIIEKSKERKNIIDTFELS